MLVRTFSHLFNNLAILGTPSCTRLQWFHTANIINIYSSWGTFKPLDWKGLTRLPIFLYNLMFASSRPQGFSHQEKRTDKFTGWFSSDHFFSKLCVHVKPNRMIQWSNQTGTFKYQMAQDDPMIKIVCVSLFFALIVNQYFSNYQSDASHGCAFLAQPWCLESLDWLMNSMESKNMQNHGCLQLWPFTSFFPMFFNVFIPYVAP